MSSNKKIVALILCIFIGYLGVHRFYLKKIGTGILYLFTMGLCGIGWIVDIILIATGKMSGLEASASTAISTSGVESPTKSNQVVVDGIPLNYSFSVKIKSGSEENNCEDFTPPEPIVDATREVLHLSHLPFEPNKKEPHPTLEQIHFLQNHNIPVPAGISRYDVYAIANRVKNKDFESPTPEMAANADGFGVSYSAFIGKRKMLSEIVHKTLPEHKAAFYAYCMDCLKNNQEIGNFFESNRMQIYFDFAAIVLKNDGLSRSLSNIYSDELLTPNKRRTIYKACVDYLNNH